MRTRLLYTLAMIFLLILSSGQAMADKIRVAVASNFTGTIRKIAESFEKSTGHKVILIFGSTGKHYAQIKHGAPFDAFFAADARRPKLLEKEGVALPGSRFTYAIGKVILWSPQKNYVDIEGKTLEQKEFRYLSLANPKLAPYGKAAQEILQGRGLWKGLRGRMVRGENIGQTFQFVKSGNAELGFIAYSQVKHPGESVEGSYWKIPQSLYSPIEQQAVLLRDNDTARSFLSFVKSDESLKIIRGFGYGYYGIE
ncbi:MAG: molybdate ABC transporter substrate-binding protein [SAR324 cluster bacterium]|uniref:Molybdate ABC transporter substrate-binding protein n=1 Tax=SAR324 cluster bacterium TaxID=2024889 RepID=A0A2A4SY87_9DELT|nr:MAG: molybdate ABC transporter substrate-binding protein [SAR324 cluster bacterium]